MTEEDEWKKLPTDQKVQHKAWKARAEGYKECLKNFPVYEEKSPEFAKYLSLVKKFVTDSNELNRIQGLQASLLYVGKASVAGRTCGEVLSGIIAKCFNTKPRLKEVAGDVCLMYVEIDKNEAVQEELIKGFENKQPKVVYACVEVITKALSLFGSKVISVKPIIKPTIKLLDNRDKNVREAAKALFVEVYRWIGPAIRAPLQIINAVVLKELEEEWEKVGPGGQAKQTRFMRSQQDLREKMEAKAAETPSAGGEGDTVEEGTVEVDAYDLLEPVDILAKLPKNFYEQIEEKKWQERKMALEASEKLCLENPKLAPGDYAELVKVLKKVLSKDTNIMLVTIAIKCIGGLAKGLRKKFQPYALVCLDGMFERFKEKKPMVVAALQDATDAIYLTTNIQAVSESCVEALGHKNPSIRAQVGLFLSRAFSKTKSSAVNKVLMKAFVQPLSKNMDHSAPDVREGAFQAIGMMFKLVGESKLMPLLADLDKLKMDKINEYAGRAVVSSSKGGSAPSNAPSKPTSVPKEKPKSASHPKPEKKATHDKKVKGGKKPKATSSNSQEVQGPPVEAVLGEADVDELVAKVISDEEKSQILNSNWKERLAGLQAALQKLKMIPPSDIPCQAFVQLLTTKPGLKDTNFNCLNEKFKTLSFLAQNGMFSRASAEFCLQGTVIKVGDIKCGAAAKAALSAISEATGFPWVSEQVLEHAMSQKNPKIQSETLVWLSACTLEFGIAGLNLKLYIEKIKTALAATNPAVRTAALSLIGTLALYIGEKLRMFFENEKSALLQQIDAEIEKVKGQSPPAPVRGLRKASPGKEEDEGEDDEGEQGAINIDDMVSRVDISGKITDGLIGQMSDKNWKERKEALDNVIEILNENKFITADIGELPGALKARLSDSNKLLMTTTLNILTQLAAALGSHCGKHLSVILSSVVNTLADSKPQLRQAALKCMNAWLENTKLSTWLEGDTMSSALSVAKQTFLRIELLNWLNEKLQAASKVSPSAREGLELCVPVIYSCCEDRSGEVRSKAQSFLIPLMRHLSYDKMVRGTSKLGATSKSSIIALLEKAREQMPAPVAKPTKPSASARPPSASARPPSASEQPDPKTSDERETSASRKSAREKRAPSAKRAPSSQRKPKQEEDTSPLFIKLPNGKELRMKDEIKLKTIKWNFTAPRDELVVQLQQQLTTCVGTTLATEMFHADFQHHLKAITMLNQGLLSDWSSTVGCLDILLRWFTLRFYDKNTTVHIKSLEYLKSLFDKLIDNDYRMSDYEVSAFVPHLLIKIGENKDNIRKAVHGILKQLSMVYPASKLFNYVMDGIKSKNSRQRSECLDEIALLIETHGVAVCQPSVSKALKEVATNIGDRDKGVRSSALNAIVAAYNESGDIVYKQVGKLNEKDMSMLEERIKRSGKFSEIPSSSQEHPMAAISEKPVKEIHAAPTNNSRPTTAAAGDKGKTHASMTEVRPSGTKDEDDECLPEFIRTFVDNLEEFNVDHLLEPLPIPDCLKAYEQGNSLSSNASAALDLIISQVSSPRLDPAITAIHELYEVIKHKEKLPLLQEKVDQLLTASTTQIRMTADRYIPIIVSPETAVNPDPNITEKNFMSLCKSHFAFLIEIFNSHVLVSQASAYVLFDMLRSILQLLINEQFASLPYATKLIQILNMLIVRMFVHCDPTAIMCATIKTQHDSMESSSPTYINLVVKCLWKLGRMIPQFLSPVEQDGFTHQPLKVATLLGEIDRYWTAYPRGHPTYVRLKTDVPLRSMKTIVLIMYKHMGDKVMDELDMIQNPESSEVVAVIRKVSGSSKIPHRSSHKKENIGSITEVSLDAKLSAVFKKIGDRQLTKQGLLELYEFKRDHPHYDVEPQINGLEVEFFRDYVKRGLKRIEEEKRTKGTIGPQKSSSSASAGIPDVTDKDYWDRLNKLRTTCGLEPLTKEGVRAKLGMQLANNGAADADSDSKVLAPSTNSLNHPEPLAFRNKDFNANSRSAASAPHSSEANATERPASTTSLSDLKRRLEQIKQSSARR